MSCRSESAPPPGSRCDQALYVLLAGLLDRVHLLSRGPALVLASLGVKLVLQAAHETVSTAAPELPSRLGLGVIVTVLTAPVVLGLRRPAPPPAAGGGAGPASAGHAPDHVAAGLPLAAPGRVPARTSTASTTTPPATTTTTTEDLR